MKFRLLDNIDNKEVYLITKSLTTIGKNNCDVNLKKSPLIEATHSVLAYDLEADVLKIRDNNSYHGTYVNDCRVKKDIEVQLSHGDIIRLGHGGPRFNVLFSDFWEQHTKMSNLPTLPARKSPAKSYPACHYARQDGYQVNNNKIRKSPPHSASRRPRPVSANTSNGSFHTTNKPVIFGNWTNGYPNETRSQSLDSVTQLDARLQETEEKLQQLASFEVERLRKDNEICTLRDEIDYLRLCVERNNTSFVSGCHEKISALRNQIQLRNEDNENLKEENESLKSKIEELASTSDNQVAEMRNRLSQCDSKILLLENEFQKATKEKKQAALLVTTLQKEVTCKNELLIRTKEELEKHRNEVRSREAEISSLVTKVEKQEKIKEVKGVLKDREEEIQFLKNGNSDMENELKKKENEVHDLSIQLAEARTALSHNETCQLEEQSCYIENTQKLSNALSEIEKRLIENGRSCSSLQQEIINLQDMEVPDHTSWVKECILSFLHHESVWEQEIEDALQLVGDKTEVNHSSPSSLIKMVQTKMDNNFKEIELLEQKINSSEKEYSKMYDVIKGKIKEKYKKKTEKALKAFEEERLSEELSKIREEEKERINNALEEQQILFNEELGKVAILTEDVTRLEKEGDELRDEIELLKTSLKGAKESEDLLIDKMEESKEMFRMKEEGFLSEEVNMLSRINELETENKELKVEMDAIQEESEKVINALQLENKEIKIEIDTEREENEKMDRTKEVSRISGELHLFKRIEALESENKKLKTQIDAIQDDLMESQNNEQLFSDKLKEASSELNTLETKCKKEASEELDAYKEKLDLQAEKVTSLEYTIITLEKGKDELENKYKSEYDHTYKQKEEKIKKQEDKITDLSKELEDLKTFNELLENSNKESEGKLNEQQAISNSLENQLNAALAKLSDLKGELSDKEKQKVEYLEQSISKKEKEFEEQQSRTLHLSCLVDEQNIKLKEQDNFIEHLNKIIENLKIPRITVVDGANDTYFADIPSDIKLVGERCIEQAHDRTIAELKSTISDLRSEISPSTTVTIHNLPTNQIEKMSLAIDNLKGELAAKEYRTNVKDQKTYDELRDQQELQKSTSRDLEMEKHLHDTTQHALDKSEELYLKFASDISSLLEIQDILGCKPLRYIMDDCERDDTLKERAKWLEIISNRIRSLQSRLQRKEELLQNYDNDLQNLQSSEKSVEQKTIQMKYLEDELRESKTETAYLQESLKKWRNECDELKRHNTSLKQNKVFKMDYKREPSPPKAKQRKGRGQSKEIYDHRLDYSHEEPVRELSSA